MAVAPRATVTDDAKQHTNTGRPGYGQLLRTAGAWKFLIPGFFARQPFAMLTIGIVLLVEHTTGSFGAAGGVSATAGVAMALIAPQSGKLADRFGQAAVLIPGAILHAALVGLLIGVALLDAPLWALFLAAVPVGASTPQVSPMVRARWVARLKDAAQRGDDDRGSDSPLLTTAAAFESVTDEFTFVIGPVLATALSTGLHPAAGLGAEGVLMLCGGLLFAGQRSTQPAPVRPRRGSLRATDSSGTNADGELEGAHIEDIAARGEPPAKRGGRQIRGDSALSVRGLRVLIAVMLGIGSVFGGLQVSLTAFTQSIGQPGLNGLMYGVFACGNMLAALAVGAIQWKRSPPWRLLVAYPALVFTALLLATVAQVTPWVVALCGLGLLVGLWVAPSMITSFTLAETLAPASVRTEAFTWLTGAIALGQAAGSTAAGQLADQWGSEAGFLSPVVGSGLALAVLLVFRRSISTADKSRVAARGVRHRTSVAVD